MNDTVKITSALALALCLAFGTGCGDDVVPPVSACSEQAALVCRDSLPGWSTDNCLAGYQADCLPRNYGVSIDAHIACLDALLDRTSHCIPQLCADTWGDPDRISHFCRI